MTWQPFFALPNYLGGKRKLASTIFREIQKVYPIKAWPSLTILDPCAGACSIALYAKAQGLQVIAGDIAERSYIVQQAVISNNAETLNDTDTGRLFDQRNGYDRFVAEHFVPNHFPLDFANFLDLALANIAEHPAHVKRALLKLILYKMMKAPRIQFSDTTISRAVESDLIETLAGHKAKSAAQWYLTPPAVIANRLARTINRAVFSNGHENVTHQCDARDLVETYAAQADILYLDPPYPGVTGYETYWVLDSVFAGHVIRPQRSRWSTPQFTLELLHLLDAATHIPLWIISYGSVGVQIQQLVALVEEYRPAKALTIAYPHLQAIARQEVSQANREYLIIAQGA